MEPSEIEFLAEKELITVIPNFSHGKLYLICGDCGPFVPSIPVQVPLWLAINLRQRQKCRILPPDWMSLEKLEEIKQEETDSSIFSPMPSEHYKEIAQLLFDVAISDIPNADEIQTLIKDIWDIRMAKLRTSVDAFVASEASHAQLDNLTVFEINFVRPLLTAALYQLQKFKRAAAASQADSQSQSASLL
ncbi:DNA replication complex GINS protein PSF2-like [Uloborus diversus]|uniref:DNA replication complex GINS protein PSF2-like n=1 Tax=Uloborus diversus TaxID=327109 RepID=UPI002409374A|nr:DNA replication complex GINS protein PSF2-like [Uloborus diversus]XP_054713835.1 DNA replication complex GINS protein PSF2-like [Uloborus diversus]